MSFPQIQFRISVFCVIMPTDYTVELFIGSNRQI